MKNLKKYCFGVHCYNVKANTVPGDAHAFHYCCGSQMLIFKLMGVLASSLH